MYLSSNIDAYLYVIYEVMRIASGSVLGNNVTKKASDNRNDCGCSTRLIFICLFICSFTLSGAPNEKILAQYLKYHFLFSYIVSELFTGMFM